MTIIDGENEADFGRDERDLTVPDRDTSDDVRTGAMSGRALFVTRNRVLRGERGPEDTPWDTPCRVVL